MPETKVPTSLTGNELALAWAASLHAINWWKNMKPQSDYVRKERRKYETLRDKLSAISDHAYPYRQALDDGFPDDYGDEEIMQLDNNQVQATRAAAERFNKEHCL